MRWVPQDAVIFSAMDGGKISYGIGRGRRRSHRPRHEAAFADDHPQVARGYSSFWRARGDGIGGQRQRISIARARLKNARFVLDGQPARSKPRDEQIVQRACRGHVEPTTIVIANRLAMCMRADRNVVLGTAHS